MIRAVRVSAYTSFILLVRSVTVLYFCDLFLGGIKIGEKKIEAAESYAGIRRGRNITSRSNFREFRDPQK